MDYSHCFGLYFGRLKVIGQEGILGSKLICICECGQTKVARLSHLKSGSVKSCGCLLIDTPKKIFGKTLASKTLEYKVWYGMKRRCCDPNHHAYLRYGGRGIIVCDTWLGEYGFIEFMKDMGERPKGYTLDRINNDGPYTPSNCRWTDYYQQANNRANNIRITYLQRSQTKAEWCKEFGINYTTLDERLKRGWSFEKSILTPVKSINYLRSFVPTHEKIDPKPVAPP